MGGLPAIAVGFFTNLLNSITSPMSVFYASISIMIAFFTGVISSKGLFRKLSGYLIEYLMLVFCGGFLGSLLTWGLYGESVGSGLSGSMALFFYKYGMNGFFSQLMADVFLDMVDKLIVIFGLFLGIAFIPDKIKKFLPYGHFYCKDYVEVKKEKDETKKHILSLKVKTAIIFTVVNSVAGIALMVLTIPIYEQNIINYYSELVKTESRYVANVVNADDVPEYLAYGDTYPGYKETKAKIKEIYDDSSYIRFAYVYKINNDDITVIFDIDTDDTEAGKLGDKIPFDKSFSAYLPDLRAGKDIEKTFITDDTYGYLITFYTPCVDSSGITQCYGCVDIDVSLIHTQINQYGAKAISIILSVAFFALAISYYFIETRVLIPSATIINQAKAYDKVGEKDWLESEEYKERTIVNTHDEMADLYDYIDKSEEEISRDFNQIEEKTAALIVMEKNVVLALANVVEARDANTGDHIARTSLYVKVIAEELLREGKYKDILTKDYVEKLVSAAPLHDIGKIVISDLVLNKPGKLDKDEFEKMKKHTVEGAAIIDMALKGVNEHSYLDIARDLAAFHHEWYNGNGYMRGLKGEEIPLCARIMAIADVFDALISKRSYKEPFSYEKSISIIKEESGTHFDPKIVEVFLSPECQNIIKERLGIKDNK